MPSEKAKARHAELAEEIRRHDHAYYNEGKSLVTDFEYDRLFQELINLEKDHPELITASSPTQRVGGTPSQGFKRVKHLQPMLSLEKIEASEEPSRENQPDSELRHREQDENTLPRLIEFDRTIRKLLDKKEVEYVMEPKVDGVSIGVQYRFGKLELGVTRGDGYEGDDITTNIRTIRGIPLELKTSNPPALLEVRGEAYISVKDFEKLNAELEASGEEAFPNARNATSGTLKQHDPKLVSKRPLSAVFYSVGAMEGIAFETVAQMLETLASFGLPTQSDWVCKNMDDVLKHYRKDVVSDYNEKHDLRHKVPYEIDGIVIKVNRISDWERIPAKPRAPGYAIVHKPVPWITPAETVLENITVQVGRTGILTPVAELKPVFLQGSTISRATLHNENEIRRKDIRIGDTVVIRKAGMVIPEVVEVLKTKRKHDSKPFDFFKFIEGKCPVCGGPIAKEKVAAGDKDEVAWRCENISGCPAQQTRRIEYFTQRKALDISSLGGIVAEKLVQNELANEPLDLFDLEKKKEKLAKLNLGTEENRRDFGEKNATKVLEALSRARGLPLNRWLYALGIPGIGEQTAYEVTRFHRDFNSIADSSLLRDAVELAKIRKQIQQFSPQSKENKTKDRVERDAMRPKWERLIDESRIVGKRLIDIGFAKFAKGKSDARDVVIAVDPIAAESLMDFFKSPIGQKVLKKLKALQIDPISDNLVLEQDRPVGILAGKTFVLTGTLPSLSRDEASKLIREAGGDVVNSVSKNTNFLLAGEGGGSKREKAQELGVKVISQDELLAMLKANTSGETRQQALL